MASIGKGDLYLEMNPDISSAETLGAHFYKDAAYFEESKDKVFARSWLFACDNESLTTNGSVYPISLLPGFLDEPLLFTRDNNGELHCLSNVCTHRANLVVETPDKRQSLRCRYHGRKFSLDGSFLSMPEFDQAKDFPRPCDDLAKAKYSELGPLLFAAIDPLDSFEELIAPVLDRISFLPLSDARFDENRSRDYLVQAHWALYCENYLEGFHIPYVHPALNKVVDYSSYTTELFPGGNLQLGRGKGGEQCFEVPKSHPDHGNNVAAYYYFLFPNTMLNVYPWGISLNAVCPISPGRTKVLFRSYVWDESLLDHGAGAALDEVEREDEEIVECVQRGIRSRLYRGGRFSPTREQGVHQFQQLLSARFSS